MKLIFPCLYCILVAWPRFAAAADLPKLDSPFRTVDLNVGETARVRISDGSTVTVKLLDLKETRDELRRAVREARVTVEVNGQRATLAAAYYRLPIEVGGIQIDCAVTAGCVQPGKNPWVLEKDARLRLWPAHAPWIQPGTFAYPVRDRWFASDTQMANEPVFVNGEQRYGDPIYYHFGLDVGGAEGLTEVVAATDGVVVIAGTETIKGLNMPDEVQPRYDTVFVRDGRGWYCRYCHLQSIERAIKAGVTVKMGQRIGLLGKEGDSGGWSHLHFDLLALQPGRKYGNVDGYAFFWQACHSQCRTQLQAVARPHHVTPVDVPAVLDATRSWSALGPSGIAQYQWLLSDGTTNSGPTCRKSYPRPGCYSEVLKVTDAHGRVDYDFAVVHVMDRRHPEQIPPAIHAAYWPTQGLKAGDEVVFKVRTFRMASTDGHEQWDFGDGSPHIDVQSDGNVQFLAKEGYAVTRHRYARPGDYLVSVTRSNAQGQSATAHLHVRVGGTWPATAAFAEQGCVTLTVVEQHADALIKRGDPGTDVAVNGVENGLLLKLGTQYHFFTSIYTSRGWTLFGNGYWTSPDGIKWTLAKVLQMSGPDRTGEDVRTDFWEPIPVYDSKEERWNLFYASGRWPNSKRGWEGRIWRAVSKTKGMEGIGGPWEERGEIDNGPRDPWESPHVSTWFPFFCHGRWLVYYGSSPCSGRTMWWKVGLAEAPSLNGPWKRLSAHNPLRMTNDLGEESPRVFHLRSGRYLCLFDVIKNPNHPRATASGENEKQTVFTHLAMGYSDSADGVHWSDARFLSLHGDGKLWVKHMRCPVGLLEEKDGTYTIYYTGMSEGFFKGFSGLGKVRVKVEEVSSCSHPS